MGVGKRVIEDFAELQSPRPVTALLDSPTGIGKDANVDAISVHDV